MKIEQIPFARHLARAGLVGSQAVLTELAPYNGVITEIEIHWPGGCNAFVDVRVGHSNVQFCPREGYLHLNNATPKYRFEEPVFEGEEIWVEMLNGDGGNPHDISVTVHVERRDQWM